VVATANPSWKKRKLMVLTNALVGRQQMKEEARDRRNTKEGGRQGEEPEGRDKTAESESESLGPEKERHEHQRDGQHCYIQTKIPLQFGEAVSCFSLKPSRPCSPG
jgi:hypothetical protein